MAKKIPDLTGTQELTVEVSRLTNIHGQRINAILYTGCAGNGKSTAGELTERLLGSKNSSAKLTWVDVSKIIARCAEQNIPLGRAVSSQKPFMELGYLLKDEYLIPTFRTWFNEQILTHPDLELLIISGLPRTPEQNELLELFGKVLVVDIKASKEISDASIWHRLQNKAAHVRHIKDIGDEEVMQTRWNEHVFYTEPAIAALNGIVLHLDRTEALGPRIFKILDHLVQMDEDSPVQRHIVDRALRRFNSETHPIHHRIREIEMDSRFHRHIPNSEIYGGRIVMPPDSMRTPSPDPLS